MSYTTRWLFSTSHKDIGILYLIYGMISAMVATAMSVIIRLELSGPGDQFLHENRQVYNVLVTGHAIAMIFLFVMPVLIGAFGNFLLPILIGGVDMAFARLNNISFWCLPPALVCIIASVLIESGAGTGWTLFGMVFKKIPFDAWNSLCYSFLTFFIEYSFISSVKISIIIGQYACISLFYMHQRLNTVIFKYSFFFSYFLKNNLSYYQIKNDNIPQFYYKNNIIDFNQWFIGFVDGCGTFNIDTNNNIKPYFTFKIIQSINNIKVLYKIKKHLGIGKISIDKVNNNCIYTISNIKYLINILLPIFESNYLLTSKYFEYNKFRDCINIYNENSLYNNIDNISEIWNNQNIINHNNISPIWKDINTNKLENINNMDYNLKFSVNEVYKIITKSWLIGFLETKDCFILLNNSNNNISHEFNLILDSDPIILYSIKSILHIASKVKYNNEKDYYYLNTSSKRVIEYIIKFFIKKDHKNLFLGFKSFEFNLWKRSFYKTNTIKRLVKVQKILDKVKDKNI